MNIYLKVFLESLWAASIVPFSSEATYVAMKSFGGYNMLPAFALAVIGATLGQSFNWLVGKLLSSRLPHIPTHVQAQLALAIAAALLLVLFAVTDIEIYTHMPSRPLLTGAAVLAEIFALFQLFRLYRTQPKIYQKGFHLLHHNGLFLLFFCWVPLGNLMPLIAGFFGGRFKRALPILVLGLAAHYGYCLL